VVAAAKEEAYLEVYLAEAKRRHHLIKIPNPATRNNNTSPLTQGVIQGKNINTDGHVE
jgi:hypothetical protein